jgi:hypothetical protein
LFFFAVCRDGFLKLRTFGAVGPQASGSGLFGWFGEGHCDLLDVLGGGGEEALRLHTHQTSEPCIAMAMQLLGICE